MEIKTAIEQVAGKWTVRFSIGIQTFHLWNHSGLKQDAEYHKEMLDKAFSNLTFANFTTILANRKDTNPTAKMAEEYLKNRGTSKDNRVWVDGDLIPLNQLLADFAEFHHKQEIEKERDKREGLANKILSKIHKKPESARQKLFDFFSEEHGVQLLDSDFNEIQNILSDLTKNDEG